MPQFISFNDFSELVARSSGILLIVITDECDEAAQHSGSALQQRVGHAATVRLMCANVGVYPTLVYYEGGDSRVVLRREGAEALRTVLEDVRHAARLAASRPTVAEEAANLEHTERMLASERLDHFPPFFRMARTLARDAWHAARSTAEGAPLLLDSVAAAARLGVCEACPSLRGDRCVECGCYMTIKAHIASTACPLDKWPGRKADDGPLR